MISSQAVSGGVWLLILGCGCAGIALKLCAILSPRNPRRLPLPPGPKPLPFIGNAVDFPKNSQWLTFSDWSKTFGDIMSVNLFGTRMIILNSLQGTTDLLEKKSAIYSDRPRMPMVVELMGHDWGLPVMKYDRKWRVFRKAFHQYFNSHVVEEFAPIQTKVTRRLLQNLLEAPNNAWDHIKLASVANAIEIAYGFEVTSHDDQYVRMAEEVMESLNKAGVPGAFLVDTFPILKYLPSWFPGGAFHLKAQRWRAAAKDFLTIPFNDVMALLHKDNSRSIVSMMTAAGPQDDEYDDILIPGIAAVTYIAGSDTTASALKIFILAMILFPDVQKTAQRKLDQYFYAKQRLPELSDRASLPYIEALVKEVLRWKPVVPLAIPHLVNQDDEYNDYFIPRGSIVLGNAWSILQDPEHYPDPSNFKPERFLKSGQIDPEVLDPDIAFGFGRRKCPGRYLAQNGLWIAIASILTCFDIGPPHDDNGRPIPVEARMTTHLTQYVPFVL